MSFVGSNILAGASGQGGGGYEIERSLRFNAGDSSYLNRTPSSAGNRKTWTWSGWVKRSILGTRQQLFSAPSGNTYIEWQNDKIQIEEYSGGLIYKLAVSAVQRDPSAWYHFVFQLDTTQATAADRVKIYINGVRQETFSSASYPSQNHNSGINGAVLHKIGAFPGTGDGSNFYYFNGYLADVHFIDGQALAATDFGETDDNGVWKAIKYAGTYGPLLDQSRAWSGDLSASNLASPTLMFNWTYGYGTYTGTCTWTTTSASYSSLSGRVYLANNTTVTLGITFKDSSGTTLGSFNLPWTGNGTQMQDTGFDWSSSVATVEITGNYLPVRVQIGNKTIVDSGVTVPDNSFHLDFKNNSSNAALGTDTSGNSNTWTVNNLTAAAAGLATANQGMDVVTYTGTGSAQSIGGLAFQPDFIWCKTRSNAVDHKLADSVRGFTKILESNQTRAEVTDTNAITAVGSTGFTLGSGGDYNSNGRTYVAWCWKAGGAAVSNTDGSINSSVSVNAAYGFSITKYVGTGSLATVGHGLGSSAPKFMLIKGLDDPLAWAVYANSPSNYFQLSDTGANNSSDASNAWNGTAPTSSVFTVKSKATVNESGENYIAYCWSEVAGFSKFGSYSGSSSNVTINTGFKPRYIIIKSDDTAGQEWVIKDSKRGGDRYLEANTSNADAAGRNVTFNADGFTLAHTNGPTNYTGRSYIYAAFAAKPDGSVIDSLVDTPTNATASSGGDPGGSIVGNYCCWNPLSATGATLVNGNLEATLTSAGSGNESVRGTIGVASGKFYWEELLSDTGNQSGHYGVVGASTGPNIRLDNTSGTNAVLYAAWNGYKAVNGTSSSYGASFTTGDVIGVALDLDGGTITFYKNNSSQGSISLPTTGIAYTPVFSWSGGASAGTTKTNWGQHAFAYTAPSGYKSLNTANLPEPTIDNPKTVFNTVLYNGDGSSDKDVDAGLPLDMVWIKNRGSATDHILADVVRGNYYVYPNGTWAQGSGRFGGFSGNTFNLSSNDDTVNQSGNTYVAWAWDAGSSNTTIAAGSLNSSLYNQSQTWSGQVSGTAYSSTYPKTLVFNGSLAGNPCIPANGNQLTFTPSPSFSNATSVKIYYYYPTAHADAFVLNGSSVASSLTTGTNVQSHTFDVTGSGFTSFAWTRNLHASEDAGMFGIEVDGKLLVDSGVSLPNVPSIASTVRANPSAGFSIVKYTGNGTQGATAGHGLNTVPELVIGKRFSANQYWAIYHKDVHPNVLLFNTSAAVQSQEQYNETRPTSSVVEFGSNGGATNTSGDESILYCFAPVSGYSAMGKYTGNGSADGPFVYTGFKVAWLMVKNASTSGETWTIYDAARDPHNLATNRLQPNAADAETSGTAARDKDLLSNGFKIRGASGEQNTNGNTYIYLAFASHPFKTARAR